MAYLYIIFPIKLTMIIKKNFMKLLSKNARIKSNILWPKMSRHVNKALTSVTIKPSKVKNRENQIRDLKNTSLAT